RHRALVGQRRLNDGRLENRRQYRGLLRLRDRHRALVGDRRLNDGRLGDEAPVGIRWSTERKIVCVDLWPFSPDLIDDRQAASAGRALVLIPDAPAPSSVKTLCQTRGRNARDPDHEGYPQAHDVHYQPLVNAR
ncbi:hypothetical protein, partial [Sphingomonas jaspsi]|uniref:hypothetical protein n=1 Tax=Sphingomonas jaspsi TaxID=392409 RepID=UPI001C54EB98